VQLGLFNDMTSNVRSEWNLRMTDVTKKKGVCVICSILTR